MKHLKQLFCLIVLLVACSAQQLFAQQMPPIPTDPNVRIGKLSNGLTYYIRKNTLPEKRAFFYIAQKVGSIQEEPQQRGLAHFLEHMRNKEIAELLNISVKTVEVHIYKALRYLRSRLDSLTFIFLFFYLKI